MLWNRELGKEKKAGKITDHLRTDNHDRGHIHNIHTMKNPCRIVIDCKVVCYMCKGDVTSIYGPVTQTAQEWKNKYLRSRDRHIAV